MTFTVYFEIFNHKFKKDIEAYDIDGAKEILRLQALRSLRYYKVEKIKVEKIEEAKDNNECFEFLKNIFGIK